MALELENDWKNTQQSRENTPPETRTTKIKQPVLVPSNKLQLNYSAVVDLTVSIFVCFPDRDS